MLVAAAYRQPVALLLTAALRSQVRILWQLAQTTSHLAISASINAQGLPSAIMMAMDVTFSSRTGPNQDLAPIQTNHSRHSRSQA